MPKSKLLQKKIESKLDHLNQLLNQFDKVRIINSNDPETWDSDTLYNLIELLKETLQLLEDKKSKPLNFSLTGGEEMVVETGLCSLIDNYQAEND